MLLAEFILNSQAAPPDGPWLYRTLLELYLTPRLADGDVAAAGGSIATAAAGSGETAAGAAADSRGGETAKAPTGSAGGRDSGKGAEGGATAPASDVTAISPARR